MRLSIIFLDPKTKHLSRLTRTTAYMEAPFPDCPACRQGQPHTPLWMAILSFVLCLFSIIVLFCSALSTMPHAPLALFAILVLASLVGWRAHQLLVQAIETRIRRRKHMRLDAPKEQPERIARVVYLLSKDAHQGLLGEQGSMAVILNNIDRLLNMAQQHQYELRLRLEGQSCPDLTETLSVIAHLRAHKQYLHDYCQGLHAFFQGCGQVASQLYAYHLMDLANRPHIQLEEGVAMVDISTLLFNGLGQVMRGVIRALRQSNPSQAINECFERTVPDFVAADQAIQAYLSALPTVPDPPPPLSPAK